MPVPTLRLGVLIPVEPSDDGDIAAEVLDVRIALDIEAARRADVEAGDRVAQGGLRVRRKRATQRCNAS